MAYEHKIGYKRFVRPHRPAWADKSAGRIGKMGWCDADKKVKHKLSDWGDGLDWFKGRSNTHGRVCSVCGRKWVWTYPIGRAAMPSLIPME